MDKILKTIKKQRLLKGLSQAVIARRLNIVSSAYGKIERGQTELTFKRAGQICEILELNAVELTQELMQANAQKNEVKTVTKSKLPIEYELDISRKINYMFAMFVDSLVFTRYRLIMSDYMHTEFTAEDWWNSLGENKEEELGMTEKEFWEMFDGAYHEVYKPEDKYDGFKKLVSDTDIFYFFRLGLVDDKELNDLFQEYLQRENLTHLPLTSKLPTEFVNSYLKGLTSTDIFESETNLVVNRLHEYLSPKELKDISL